jgi:dienelactone hydrolase
VNAFLCKWLDAWVIRSAAARMPGPCGCDPQLDAAEGLIRSEDFFRTPVEAAKLEFLQGERFRFQSPIQTPFDHNNVVYGRLYRSGENWQSRPSVILLHGWNDELNHRFRFPTLARQFNRAGINCAMIELPYHFQRKPHPPATVQNFISEDILRTVEATQQSLADIRALAGWLREQGSEQVSIWGISLGAWLAGLAICHGEQFHSAVLLTPVARMDRMIAETAFVEPVRRALKGGNVDLSIFNLREHEPQIPRENILLVEAKYDRFVPAETVEELWNAWNQPEIWRRNCGHVTAMMSFGLMKSTAEWVASRSHAVPASADQR